jgi:hypothetical protein
MQFPHAMNETTEHLTDDGRHPDSGGHDVRKDLYEVQIEGEPDLTYLLFADDADLETLRRTARQRGVLVEYSKCTTCDVAGLLEIVEDLGDLNG